MANYKATFGAQTPFTKQQKKQQIKEEWSFSFLVSIK